ncbi:gamma carbonic anhydrase family protein [Rhodococcus sp. HNM0569]|uniref:gamma carbonic anhydrase family protein n=1 Tax=Rhodococcus sp. HNM0569 TaxID=2716340 RepID=UPI00146BCB68|nr:gamma carbonic anhydrase family protein [Rhodococcus sp. HNM0569]NLU83731.1 gamma carbonic anhydrase family protein [Rhodococcus sp. HNM0569]
MILSLGDQKPDVDDTAWVADSATVVGRVTIGAGVGVFYSAVVRGDMDAIVIGDDSNIQDGAVLHADPGKPLTMGKRISVGHNATLHGCTIEDDVLIGMGATVLNGAKIGAGSLIAAGALVTEGVEVPPGSLVAGVPGKVRRELGDPERDGIVLNAQVYRELTKQHATDTHS